MLSLTNRARVRRAIGMTRRRPVRHMPDSVDFQRELRWPSVAEERSVSSMLWARLAASDQAEIERRVQTTPELELPEYDPDDPSRRRPLLLSYAMWLGMPAVAEKTQLPSVQPLEHIHAMARGPLAAAGGLYEADMTIDALRRVGSDLDPGQRALDFGCSSGRVVRVLAAAYPGVRWFACDPNEQAITWATTNLPGIEFFANDQAPPLPFEDGSFDLVYGMSIWSHFALLSSACAGSTRCADCYGPVRISSGRPTGSHRSRWRQLRAGADRTSAARSCKPSTDEDGGTRRSSGSGATGE